MECILLCVWETDRLITKKLCLLWEMTILCLSHYTAVIHLLSTVLSLLLLSFSLLQSLASLLSQYKRNSDRWRDHFPSCLFRLLSSSQDHSDMIFFCCQSQIYHVLHHILKIFSCMRWLESFKNLFLSYWWSRKMYNTNISMRSTEQKSHLSCQMQNSCAVFDIEQIKEPAEL